MGLYLDSLPPVFFFNKNGYILHINLRLLFSGNMFVNFPVAYFWLSHALLRNLPFLPFQLREDIIEQKYIKYITTLRNSSICVNFFSSEIVLSKL